MSSGVYSLDTLLEKCRYKDNETFIVSIDVGINNMAIISSTIVNNTIISIDTCELVNIKEETINCCNPKCILGHTKSAIDWVNHFIYKFKKQLDLANVILIEQQPPGGLQHIEILIIKEYRNKIINVSPRSLHTWMLLEQNTSYEKRKEKMEQRAEPYLKNTPAWKKNTERKHDLADALCFILFHLEKNKERETVRENTPLVCTPEFDKVIETFIYSQNNLS